MLWCIKSEFHSIGEHDVRNYTDGKIHTGGGRVGSDWAGGKHFFTIRLFGTIDEHNKALCRAFSALSSLSFTGNARQSIAGKIFKN